MAGWVKQHTHRFLWLIASEPRAAGLGVRDSRLEILYVDVEGQHLVLATRLLWPYRRPVVRLGLVFALSPL